MELVPDSSLPRGVGTCLEPQNVPRGFSPGAPWEAEGEGISVAGEGWVMSVRQPQEEKKKPCDGHMGTGDSAQLTTTLG